MIVGMNTNGLPCQICGSLRDSHHLIKQPACAEYDCCFVWCCADQCHFTCQQLLTENDAFLLPSDGDQQRHFLCLNCYSLTIRCSCAPSNAHYQLISETILRCSVCQTIHHRLPIQIWYGLSRDEYQQRYM